MSQKKRGIGFYFKVDIHTLQGKITGSFLSIALLATIMLAFNTYEWRKIANANAYLAREVGGAKFLAERTRYSIAENNYLFTIQENKNQTKLESNIKTASNLLDSLETILLTFNEESSVRLGHSFISQGRALISKQEAIRKSKEYHTISETEYQKLNLDLEGYSQLFINDLSRIEKSNNEYINKRMRLIPYLILGQYGMAFVLASIVASFIIINVLKRVRSLKLYIKELALGKIMPPLTPSKDELNTIISGLNELTQNLENITLFAEEVGKGKFDTNISVFNNENDLGEALAGMRNSLQKVGEEERFRTWRSEGLAKFATLQRDYAHSLNELCDAFISQLIKYIQINQGAIFLLKGDDHQQFLELTSCYAFDRKKYVNKRVEIGNGLVGQAFLEKEKTYLLEIPTDYINITSGLGEANPSVLLIVPLIHNEQVVGVMELASFKALPHYQIEFIDDVTSGLAGAVSSVKVSQETLQLLQESQMVTEQMRAQEEEMRQNMEELQATQEEMERKTKEISNNLAESESLLEGINSTLSTIEFEPDGTILKANTNFLNAMGYTQNEIIGKNHQIFVPDHILQTNEYQSFWSNLALGKANLGLFERITSKNELVKLNAIYSPIKNAEGDIIKVIKMISSIKSKN